jgi:hypothetical protein
MFNQIKFATGLILMVVFTAAMFGLSIKSRNHNSEQSLDSLAPVGAPGAVVTTAVAKERFESIPDADLIAEVYGYDADVYAALASGVVNDTEDLAILDSLDFGAVRDVKIDGERVLLATAGGVIEFYPEDSSFVIYSDRQGLADHDCYSLLVEGADVYVGTNGGVYLIEDCGAATRIWPEIADTVNVIKHYDNEFYIGTRSSGLFVSNWDTIDQISPVTSILDVTKNQFGLWVLSAKNGLQFNDGSGWKPRHLKRDSTVLASATCLTSAYNQPWLGTPKGAYFFNGGVWTLIDSTKGLFYQNVTAITKGMRFVYLGTDKGGVFSYYDGALSPLDWSEGLAVSALDVDNGNYLVGLQRGGAIFRTQKGETINILDVIRKTGAGFTGI